MKKKVKKVRWITVFGHECTDQLPEEATYYDADFEVLVVDGDIMAGGDWYHDKISDYIAGFLDCLNREYKIDFTREDVVIPLEDSWDGVHVPEEKAILYCEVKSTEYEPRQTW